MRKNLSKFWPNFLRLKIRIRLFKTCHAAFRKQHCVYDGKCSTPKEYTKTSLHCSYISTIGHIAFNH